MKNDEIHLVINTPLGTLVLRREGDPDDGDPARGALVTTLSGRTRSWRRSGR
jgi:hypothetical protein